MIDQVARRIRENIQKVIVGKDEVINLVMVAVLCEGHILLEDVPGTGKTTLAKAVAASLGCTFRRIQFTPDLLPSDVTGINFYNQKLQDRKSTRLNSSHSQISYAVFCLKKKKNKQNQWHTFTQVINISTVLST